MTLSFPGLPERIKDLGELASDLWWSWHYRARDLFRRLDYPVWRLSAHNPVAMLRQIAPERLEAVARDRAFLALYDDALRDLRATRASRESWWSRTRGEAAPATIAYFSAEFAMHQSLPIYAGGLGVLAGDFCKEASDLGMPFVGVGFMYPQGYFHQKVTADGWQEETYEILNWDDTPTRPTLKPDGSRCVVSVPLGTRTVHAAVWQVRAGKVRLFLLDTDIEENAPWDRGLSARLYGGNQELRLQQEIVLGLGGVRALHAMGTRRSWHCSGSGTTSSRAPASMRRSSTSARRRCSPPTRPCPPATTRSRSRLSKRTWPGRGAAWANTAIGSSPLAPTTPGSGRSST
jgi:starch phosphorylase